ncbi:MAG: biotin--[acetyl-CoA-carboxylase] ligase [Fimbriimonadia bacterium]|jgi:BirA family biotin operon repressor/biotin-[acetyl-CoA-carboxylase] ligase
MLPRELAVLRLRTVGSTQDVAVELVRKGWRQFDAVRADTQTSGRGRWGTDWYSGEGNLAISYILWGIRAPVQAGMIGLAAACSLAEVVEQATGAGCRVRLRWPNDVLVEKCKVAGVLVEVVADPESHPVVVLGVGLNVNAQGFPAELAGRACSIRHLCGKEVDVDGMEITFWDAFRSREPWDAARTVSEFRARDDSAGRQVQTPDGLTGIAIGITDLGYLRVRFPDGSEDDLPSSVVTLRAEGGALGR